MEWIAENWFLILIIILFVGMHMFGHGHGSHGGHGGHGKQGGGHGGCGGGHGHKHGQDSPEDQQPSRR